jgi:hypothetical protein
MHGDATQLKLNQDAIGSANNTSEITSIGLPVVS